MKLGRASNFEDLLQRTPGVFLQSETVQRFQRSRFEGPESLRRRATRCDVFTGRLKLQTRAMARQPLEDFDVAALSHAEVFRGADAF